MNATIDIACRFGGRGHEFSPWDAFYKSDQPARRRERTILP